MVQLLLQLHKEQTEMVLNLQQVDGSSDAQLLRRLIKQLGVRPATAGACASPADLLLAGFDPRTEPFLRQKVADMVRHSLEDLAAGRLVVEGSLLLPGRWASRA